MPKLSLTRAEKQAIIKDLLDNWEKHYFRKRIEQVIAHKFNNKMANINVMRSDIEKWANEFE